MPQGDDEQITVEDIDNSLSNVAPTPNDVVVSPEQYLAAFTKISDEKDALLIEKEKLKSKAKTTEILDELIKPYASKVFWFMISYCGFVGLFLLVNAFGCFPNEAPESVLKFMVGSTATTVIGLVGMVLTGIFVGARPK